MTKRELLENYRLLVIEINTLERQSKFLNQFIGGPRPLRAVQLTGMPRGTNDPEAAILQRQDADDALFALERKSEELRNMLSEFERIIEAIPDQYDRLIIRNYYALGYTDKRIGEEIGFDKSTVWKRRNRVISAIDC